MYIIQLGNDQLTEKATYYARLFKEIGLHTVYLTEDRSGLSKSFIENLNLDGHILPNGIFKRFFKTYKFFKEYKPKYVELYLSQRPWYLLSYYFLARFFKCEIFVWCRGELRNYNKHHILRRLTNKFLLKNVEHVFLRELYMKDVLQQNQIIPKNTAFIHNGVHIQEKSCYHPNSKKILFMNSFKDFRNVDFLIESFYMSSLQFPELELLLVGSTLHNKNYSPASNKYELYLRTLVKKYKIENKVSFIDFTSDRIKYFNDCFLFVLPANIVFLNYTLLEAMSHGIPSLIIETQGADYIIDHGVDGLISKKDRNEFSKYIVDFYLKDNVCKSQFSINSMDKVSKKLSVK